MSNPMRIKNFDKTLDGASILNKGLFKLIQICMKRECFDTNNLFKPFELGGSKCQSMNLKWRNLKRGSGGSGRPWIKKASISSLLLLLRAYTG
jgi:hypothetical protein